MQAKYIWSSCERKTIRLCDDSVIFISVQRFVPRIFLKNLKIFSAKKLQILCLYAMQSWCFSVSFPCCWRGSRGRSRGYAFLRAGYITCCRAEEQMKRLAKWAPQTSISLTPRSGSGCSVRPGQALRTARIRWLDHSIRITRPSNYLNIWSLLDNK